MNELLHKFKLGNDAELLLEKRGGGYEKVATVPIGSQALGVTQSAQGVGRFLSGDVVLSVPVVLHNLTVDSIGVAQTGAQRLDFCKIPAKSLIVGDSLLLTVAQVKSGASDTCAGAIRAGSSNSATDLSIIGGPSMSGTQTSVGVQFIYRITSPTTIRLSGAVNASGSLIGPSTGGVSADVAIPNINTDDMYVGVYATMASGTEFPTLRSFIVQAIPGA